MAHISAQPGQFRVEVNGEPYLDKCAFHDDYGPAGPDGYIPGRTVKGFGFNGQLAFLGHMCFDCMKYWRIPQNENR